MKILSSSIYVCSETYHGDHLQGKYRRRMDLKQVFLAYEGLVDCQCLCRSLDLLPSCCDLPRDKPETRKMCTISVSFSVLLLFWMSFLLYRRRRRRSKKRLNSVAFSLFRAHNKLWWMRSPRSFLLPSL